MCPLSTLWMLKFPNLRVQKKIIPILSVTNSRNWKKVFNKYASFSALNLTPYVWWDVISGPAETSSLSKIASTVLNIPPTSAAVERSFSRQSWLHSARRNRLSNENAAKLVYIAHNRHVQTKSKKSSCASFSADNTSNLDSENNFQGFEEKEEFAIPEYSFSISDVSDLDSSVTESEITEDQHSEAESD